MKIVCLTLLALTLVSCDKRLSPPNYTQNEKSDGNLAGEREPQSDDPGEAKTTPKTESPSGVGEEKLAEVEPPKETPSKEKENEVPTEVKPVVNEPEGCSGMSMITAKDLVIFDGEMESFANNAFTLKSTWKIDEAWDPGKLGMEDARARKAVTFTNADFYHGFKIAAPNRKEFRMSGVEFYVDSTKDEGQFGLRIIKPGEDEGNGGAATTSWFRINDKGDGAENKADPMKIGKDCKVLKFYTPKSFTDANKTSVRLIWEFMPNWEAKDKARIYKIVIKDFAWK